MQALNCLTADGVSSIQAQTWAQYGTALVPNPCCSGTVDREPYHRSGINGYNGVHGRTSGKDAVLIPPCRGAEVHQSACMRSSSVCQCQK